jgi:long-chain fatty acid transport protein
MAGVWAAWRPHDAVSIGAGVQVLTGTFVSQVAFSACPATLFCAPEDTQYDSIAQLASRPYVAPTGSVGIQVRPHRAITLGASFNLPISVDANATLKIRMPSAPFYDGASVQGTAIRVGFTLAPIARVGVEVRPTTNTRIEVAAVWEGWSVHDRLSLIPNGIRIVNARGVGTYEIGDVSLVRNFQDTWSVRVGGEHSLALGTHVLSVRAGFSYETSATAPEYTQALTFDAAKATASVGASFTIGRVRLDAMFAHTFWGPVETIPCAYNPSAPTACAGLYPTAAFRTGPQTPRYTVNGGTYDPTLNAFGLGARIGF